MAESKSGNEALAADVATMGPDLGALYHVLSAELTWAYWRWRQYVSLFGSGQRRLDILDSSAPFFFYIIQRTLWFETLLGIARLAGPEVSLGKQNLSIRQLPPLISDPTLKATVASEVDKAVAAGQFAIDWRNRHIAHRDLDLSLNRSPKPLPPASQQEVEAALLAIATTLNLLQSKLQGSTTVYTFSSSSQGAEALLSVLRDGLRREELRQRKLEQGKYDPEDWNDDLPAV